MYIYSSTGTDYRAFSNDKFNSMPTILLVIGYNYK